MRPTPSVEYLMFRFCDFEKMHAYPITTFFIQLI